MAAVKELVESIGAGCPCGLAGNVFSGLVACGASGADAASAESGVSGSVLV
jgi:hypothetical protein